MKHISPIQCRNLFGYFSAIVFVLFLGGCADSPMLSFSGESSAAQVKQLLAQAYEHMARNDDASAERVLLDAQRLDPGNPWVALNLGVIHQRHGQAEMARAEYRKALVSPTSDVRAVSVSGTLSNGASLLEIALHNLGTLEKVASTNGITTVSTPPIKPRQVSAVRQGDDDADTKSVRLAIEAWRSAWSTRDVKAYLNSYQPDFYGTKPDRKAWEAYRRKRIVSAVGRIELQIQKMKIIVKGDEAQVRFKQHYRTNIFKDSGIKELSLVRAKGEWGIYKETFMADSK